MNRVDLEAPMVLNFDGELVVGEGTYAAYQHNYIKKKCTPELPFWQQFAEHVRLL